jgi:ribosomal subunit interface protein
MTFPAINFKFNDLPEAQALRSVVEQKCATLGKYLNDAGSIVCDFEFSKIAPRQHGQIYHTEANVAVDGMLYRAEATEESFEKAIDKIRDELDRELRVAKERQNTRLVQGGRKVKEQLLGV